MKKILMALTLVLFLPACAQVELASHYAKKAFPEKTTDQAQTASQGSFKVGTPYMIAGKRYHPKESYTSSETGIASWYGEKFHGKQTANGEIYNMNELTAAHRTLQMPSIVRVTNLENGKSVILRVNDRGPFARGRIIDVSKRAAGLLDFQVAGTARVRVDVLKDESLKVAEMAKRGQSTNGFEVALNQGRTPPSTESYQMASVPAMASDTLSTQGLQPVGDVSRERLSAAEPLVTQMPVEPTSIYVQAGAFTVYDNAQQLGRKLERLAQAEIKPATVNGRQFYRVRLGPLNDVAHADQVLANLISSGNNEAIIVVD